MKDNIKSRRDFLIGSLSKKESDTSIKSEKLKMLTPDGTLVEVDIRTIKDRIPTSKASNEEILNWMKNDSVDSNKENSKE